MMDRAANAVNAANRATEAAPQARARAPKMIMTPQAAAPSRVTAISAHVPGVVTV